MKKPVLIVALVMAVLMSTMSFAGNDCIKLTQVSYSRTPALENTCEDKLEVRYCYTQGGVPYFTCPKWGRVTVYPGMEGLAGGADANAPHYEVKWEYCNYDAYMNGGCNFSN